LVRKLASKISRRRKREKIFLGIYFIRKKYLQIIKIFIKLNCTKSKRKRKLENVQKLLKNKNNE
jgi:hypothetical protein